MPALELRSIHKWFGSVHALRGADFALAPGEIHALLGENGAGKSTLMHVAGGLLEPDRGEVVVDGVPRRIGSPRAARRLGIGMVHQHFTAVGPLTVAENVALAAGWRVEPRALARRVAELSERLGLPLDPAVRADTLPVGLRQRLEIVKALAGTEGGGGRILLLDEPTAVLAPAEADELIGVLRGLADRGAAIGLITHRLDEALRAADRVTVLRRGEVTFSGPAEGVGVQELAERMIGPDAAAALRAGRAVTARPPAGQPVVVCRGVSVRHEAGDRLALRDATLTVRAGEIVGIAAVEGNGERELLRLVAGLLAPAAGELEVARPLGFIPADRTTEGLIADFSLAENLTLGLGAAAPWVRRGWIDWRAARRATAELLQRHRVTAPGPDAPAGSLSGGNQQKLIVARELARGPRVLVAEHPTRGLDVRASAAVHELLRGVAAAGAGVLVHSSDLDEVLELADRVVAVRSGRLHPVYGPATREVVGRLMLRGGA
ncbi:MAG TPA: ABC transporter ATP-binding protein [Gemmatimonadales bacterium]|nr:ABC transporter ATP-binding protein [Gemmatimonadales bacterium]